MSEEYEDREYIYSYIDYDESIPTPIPYRMPSNYRRFEVASDDVEIPRGLIGAKAVFGTIVFTALITSVVNPNLLIYTLPIATLLVTILALAGGGWRRRESRRLKPCLDT
jgi:hypothetical protein